MSAVKSTDIIIIIGRNISIYRSELRCIASSSLTTDIGAIMLLGFYIANKEKLIELQHQPRLTVFI